MTTICPACGGTDCVTLTVVPRSPTSDGVILNARSDTTLCESCGFAFNASGARGVEAQFYSSEYDLLSESGEAEFVYETTAGVRGINDEMADYILDGVSPPMGATVLDVGCGKGLLLRALQRLRTDLMLCGVEPSRHARRFSERLVPQADIHVSVLSTSPFANRHFDLLTCVGVFEHVPDPVGFAAGLRSNIGDQGRLFVSVPNFAENPTDVVTYDHLSRFTPGTFQAVLSRAGFVVEKIVAPKRVPMWALARVAEREERFSSADDERAIPRAAAAWFEASLRAISEQVGCMRDGRRLGVYGTGLIVPSAVALGAIEPDAIEAVFDDNAHMHGATKLGRKVLPLSAAGALGITDILLSANPVYWNRMKEKVSALGADIRVWNLPEPETMA